MTASLSCRGRNRIEQKEESLDSKLANVEQQRDDLSQQLAEVEEMKEQARLQEEKIFSELGAISGLTVEEARTVVLDSAREEYRHDMAVMYKQMEDETKVECRHYGTRHHATAIHRYSADYVSESTVTVVTLPNDDMKGRIIGRESRNIRAIETLTGVDLIIDDTPEAVILSSFNPIRREVARIALRS